MELFEIKMECNTNRFSECVTMKYVLDHLS